MNFLFDGKMYNMYEVFGTHMIRNSEELKVAYRKKAKEVHPDWNPGINPKTFQILNRANEIMKKRFENQINDKTYQTENKNYQAPPTVNNEPNQTKNTSDYSIDINFLQMRLFQSREYLEKINAKIKESQEFSLNKVNNILEEYYKLFDITIIKYMFIIDSIKRKTITNEEYLNLQKDYLEAEKELRQRLDELNKRYLGITTLDENIKNKVCNVKENPTKYVNDLNNYIMIELNIKRFIKSALLKRWSNRSQNQLDEIYNLIINMIKEKVINKEILINDINESYLKNVIKEGKKSQKKH